MTVEPFPAGHLQKDRLPATGGGPAAAAAAAAAPERTSAAGPHGRDRAKNLLCAAGKPATWAVPPGLEPAPGVPLHPSVTGRFTAHAPSLSGPARRTLGTNLRSSCPPGSAASCAQAKRKVGLCPGEAEGRLVPRRSGRSASPRPWISALNFSSGAAWAGCGVVPGVPDRGEPGARPGHCPASRARRACRSASRAATSRAARTLRSGSTVSPQSCRASNLRVRTAPRPLDGRH
jgi:hypothetical protein